MSIELGKMLGATVLATTRNPNKVAKMQEIGADHVRLMTVKLLPRCSPIIPEGGYGSRTRRYNHIV